MECVFSGRFSSLFSPPSQHPVLQLEPVAGITEMEMEEGTQKREKEREETGRKEWEWWREQGQTDGKREKVSDIMCGRARRWEQLERR